MPLIDSTHFTVPHQLIVQLIILNTTVRTLCYYKQLVFRYSHIKNLGGFLFFCWRHDSHRSTRQQNFLQCRERQASCYYCSRHV